VQIDLMSCSRQQLQHLQQQQQQQASKTYSTLLLAHKPAMQVMGNWVLAQAAAMASKASRPSRKAAAAKGGR
jgi:hypothetical protein